MATMLASGPALKVTIHLNRDTGAAHGFLVDEVLAFLRRSGVAGATVLEAHAGYGTHRHLHTSGAGDVAGLHLPVAIYFIERQETFEAIQEELLALITDGLVEVHATSVLKNVASSDRVIS
jgi:PII-like signaling protein